MERIPRALFERMAAELSDEDRDEMAIPSYCHPNPLLRFVAHRRVERLAKMLERRCRELRGLDPLTLMDFGCGTGVLLAECCRHARRVYGVDPLLGPATTLVAEWGLEGVELLTPAELDAKVGDDRVDVVVAGEVLEHVEPLAPTLETFGRVLKPPHGRLLVSLPTENALYRLGRRVAGFEGHYHHSNASSIHREIVRAGYRLERREALPLPGPLSIYWLLEYSLG